MNVTILLVTGETEYFYITAVTAHLIHQNRTLLLLTETEEFRYEHDPRIRIGRGGSSRHPHSGAHEGEDAQILKAGKRLSAIILSAPDDAMELIVFDLDGTLLNRHSEVSGHTRDTLRRLGRRGIAYTVATGRTLHAARDLLAGHGFVLPHIYKNGVMIWQPTSGRYSHSNLLSNAEIKRVYQAFMDQGVNPFIFTVERGNQHAVYHPPLKTEPEREIARAFSEERGLTLLPVARIPADADITNISALGDQRAIEAVKRLALKEEHLVAYAGMAIEGEHLHWVDIHHRDASKGGAVARLKEELGVSRVICFGDSDNDLSMFTSADECYAPSNAKEEVKSAATAVIGHHDEDGISRFLRQRFDL